MIKKSLLVYITLAIIPLSIVAIIGEGTYYTSPFTADDGAAGYNCGYKWVPTKAKTYFAAAGDWSASANCGRCISLKCIDPKCTTN